MFSDRLMKILKPVRKQCFCVEFANGGAIRHRYYTRAGSMNEAEIKVRRSNPAILDVEWDVIVVTDADHVQPADMGKNYVQ